MSAEPRELAREEVDLFAELAVALLGLAHAPALLFDGLAREAQRDPLGETADDRGVLVAEAVRLSRRQQHDADADGDESHWIALNIGDSRVYLLRDDRLVQITTDHSVVQELITAGKLSPEEAEGHPYSNVITRAVGASELTAPDYVSIDVRAGDRFVICSDGLTKELTDYGIQHFLREHDDPGAAADAMLAAALENGGRDNVTLIIVQVTAEDDSSSPIENTAE